MSYTLSKLSRSRLVGVHPDLVRVIELAITRTDVDFRVAEGLRTKARQEHLVAQGKSHTRHSRHLTGHAVDVVVLVGGVVSWDLALYRRLWLLIQAAAKQLGIPVEWGGNWPTLRDGPHFQLPFARYI